MTLEELLRQGKSFGQGASNAAASTVTGPVDMLAWLLRKGGVDVGEAPIGGEAWMRQKGLMATPENRLAGLLGEGAGLAAPIVAAAKAPQIARGLLSLDDHAMDMARKGIEGRMVSGGLLQPATVWHGSPHKFDKFDSSKIGTGEGAQAYGHGLYLAESPDVAQSYQKNLSQFSRFDGKPISGNKDLSSGAKTYLLAENADLPKAIQNIKDAITRKPNNDLLPPILKELESISPNSITKSSSGQLYKVDLPDDAIAKMLDWDKPLSQQPKAVQTAYKKYLKSPQASEHAKSWTRYSDGMRLDQAEPLLKNPGGENLYKNAFQSREAANQWALENGIPGIRYLDGGSRSAGAGSSNFVVFPGNEGLLKILERNGGKP